jgi:hypothetical protein
LHYRYQVGWIGRRGCENELKKTTSVKKIINKIRIELLGLKIVQEKKVLILQLEKILIECERSASGFLKKKYLYVYPDYLNLQQKKKKKTV